MNENKNCHNYTFDGKVYYLTTKSKASNIFNHKTLYNTFPFSDLDYSLNTIVQVFFISHISKR